MGWYSTPRVCACAVLLALRFGHARIVMATIGFWVGAYAIADGRVDVHHIMLFQAMLFATLSILPNRGLWHISSIPHALCISAMGTVAFWPLTWLQEGQCFDESYERRPSITRWSSGARCSTRLSRARLAHQRVETIGGHGRCRYAGHTRRLDLDLFRPESHGSLPQSSEAPFAC